MNTPERVGVISRGHAAELDLLGHGFMPLGRADILDDIEQAIRFVARPDAELDPSLKQIIPYAIVCHGDRVFVVERLSGGGESRLHGKVSIGIGGHINPIDDTRQDRPVPQGLIRTTMERELDEELVAAPLFDAQVCGFINDDTQAVGQVHLGVVFRAELVEPQARVREVDALRGGFLTWSDLSPLRPRMETWSQFVADAFQRDLLG